MDSASGISERSGELIVGRRRELVVDHAPLSIVASVRRGPIRPIFFERVGGHQKLPTGGQEFIGVR